MFFWRCFHCLQWCWVISMTSRFTLQLQNRKMFTLKGQSFRVSDKDGCISPPDLTLCVAFTLKLWVFRNQKWYSMTLLWPSQQGRLLRSYALCHFPLRLNHSETLFDLFCAQQDKYQAVCYYHIKFLVIVNSRFWCFYVNRSPCDKASSYLQRRWPSVVPRRTWGRPQSAHCGHYLSLDFFSSVWSLDKLTEIKWYFEVG